MKKFLLALSFFLCFSAFYSQTLMNENFTVLPKDVTVSAKLMVAVFRLVHPANFPPKS